MSEYFGNRGDPPRDIVRCRLLGIVFEFVMIVFGNAMLAMLGVGTLIVLTNLIELGGFERAADLTVRGGAFFLPLVGITFVALMIGAYTQGRDESPE